MPTSISPMLTTIALTLALLPQGDSWVHLSLPSLCAEPPATVSEASAVEGSHLLLGERQTPPRPGVTTGLLPVDTLLELAAEGARRAGQRLDVHRPAPPLLLRGDGPALEAARTLVEDLEAAGADQEIELEAWLAPSFLPAAREPQDLGSAARHLVGRVRSGGLARLGTQHTRSFLAGFDVEVASGSSAADPLFGRALYGRGVDLRAWRVEGGSAVLVAGRLDLVELASLETLESGDPDLGDLARPLLNSATVDFAGRIENGTTLRVALRGTPLEAADWTLLVRARTVADGRRTWRVADLALLEEQLDELPLPLPGAGLEGRLTPRPPAVLAQALPSAALWGQVEATRDSRGAGGGAAARPILAYARGLIVAPGAEQQLWTEIEALVGAAQAARTRTGELSVRRGELEVLLPIAEGRPARILVGTETLALVDFDVEIATESWMGRPAVHRIFDGLLVQGHLSGIRFPATIWSSSSSPTGVVERDDTTYGRVELLERKLASGTPELRSGETFRALDGGPEDSEVLLLTLTAPPRRP